MYFLSLLLSISVSLQVHILLSPLLKDNEMLERLIYVERCYIVERWPKFPNTDEVEVGEKD